MGQSIVLDQAALDAAGVKYETPVTVRGRKMATRTVLRSFLSGLGLTYVIKDQAIQVTTPEKARQTLTTRTYYIGDLLGTRGGPGDPLTYIFGPGIGQLQMIQNIASIMSMIQTSVDPQSWQSSGGPGAIYFHYPSLSIVIKQSAEVHGMIGTGMLP
jgi:hypothetical protein